jgi:copper homeostasis protein
MSEAVVSASRGVILEACVASVAQARAAALAGADRVELCGPGDGGTTPSLGLLEACKAALDVPVHVMVRAHTEHFVVNPEWRDVMLRDIQHVIRSGADAIVIGPLTASGDIDIATTSAFVDAAGNTPVVFHRAFDQVPDQLRALDALIALGVQVVLTSGGMKTALEGASMLSRLQERAGTQLSIMAGGGVRSHNVGQLLDAAPLRVVHARATDPEDFARTAAALRAWENARASLSASASATLTAGSTITSTRIHQ